MPVYSAYTKQRIVFYVGHGYKPPTIEKLLREEGLSTTRQGIAAFIKSFEETGSIASRHQQNSTVHATPDRRNALENARV